MQVFSKQWIGGLASVLLLLLPGLATAQDGMGATAGIDNFSRSRNISVRQRERPDYEAMGIRAGAFFLYPRVEVSVGWNDNIYAAETGAIHDGILQVRPELAIESNWSRHFLSTYLRGGFTRYADHGAENTDDHGLGVSGRIDVSRGTSVAFGAELERGHEPRTAPNAPRSVVESTAVNTTQVHVGGSRSAGYVRLSGRADWRAYDYEDGRTALGTVIDQDGRDRVVRSITGRVDLAFSPDTAVFLQATGNARRYDVRSVPSAPNRDSRGAEYLLGTSFELSAVVRGEVAVGYIQQSFDQAVFRDVSGFGARAQLEWFPSALTTIGFGAGRTVEDTPVNRAGAYVADSASVTIDHELRRNVILDARLAWSRDDYEGVDRQDRRIEASLGATYLLNRNLGLNASLSRLDATSRGLARDQDFAVSRLTVALVTQF